MGGAIWTSSPSEMLKANAGEIYCDMQLSRQMSRTMLMLQNESQMRSVLSP